MTRGAAAPLTPGAGQLAGDSRPAGPQHPAKYSPNVVATMRAALRAQGIRGNVLDPFGGVGGVHDLIGPGITTWCNELEPEWAHQGIELGWTRAGDMFDINMDSTWCRMTHGVVDIEPGPPTWDVIATSPTYGNRMADHHNARDGSKRITYKHKLGRDLSPNSSAVLAFGPEYKAFHLRAYSKFRTLLRPGGLVLLNVSDFQRKHEMVEASAWHDMAMRARGFEWVKTYNVPTPRMGYGQNGQARAEFEQLFVYRMPVS